MTETGRKICKRLHAYVRLDRYAGKVHAVYSTRVVLETPIGMVSILTNAHCLQPFSVVVNSTKQFPNFNIEEGQEVLIGDERIEIPACEFAVDLSQATDLDLSVEIMQSLFLPMDLDIRMRHLLRVIESTGESYDVSPLVTEAKTNDYCDAVRPLLPALHEAVREQEGEDCRKAAAAIAGFGNSRIPSSDMLLCGYNAGYAALSAALGRSRPRVLSITREIASGAAERTTETAAALLLQSGEGLVSEDTFQLLQCIFSDASYPTMVAYANKVAKAESGNGSDILTGIYLAVTKQLG
jgi:hypothetical protein